MLAAFLHHQHKKLRLYEQHHMPVICKSTYKRYSESLSGFDLMLNGVDLLVTNSTKSK
jgi:hypothetical protein